MRSRNDEIDDLMALLLDHADRAEIMICKSRSCAACSDGGLCFGPETASTVQRAEAKA